MTNNRVFTSLLLRNAGINMAGDAQEYVFLTSYRRNGHMNVAY